MKEEEKLLMEVTKSEAMFILYERLENKWYVELEPLFTLGPGVAAVYLIYEYTNLSLFISLPIVALCFYIFWRQIKRRRDKAQELYKQFKSK